MAITNSYIVEYLCDKCGEPHRVANDFRLVGGPTEGGSLDELYPDGNLPPPLVQLLGDLAWCPSVAEWVDLDDPARVSLLPRRAGYR